jgi:hypothetical protein
VPDRRVYNPKLGAAFGVAIALFVWVFTNVSEFTQQIMVYVGVGSVIAVLIWGMWKFRA